MLFERDGKRGQTAVEYMLALAMTITLVASIMVPGLREIELDLALGAARMGGTDFTAQNSNYTLGSIGYAINETDNTVNVTPRFYLRGSNTVADADWQEAQSACFFKVKSVFFPGDYDTGGNYCFDASYRRYCISPVMTPA